MSFEIEKGVPMPPTGPARLKYPFANMQPGDSFAVPSEDGNRLRAAASFYGIQKGWILTCRRQPDGSVRCWRVK